MLGYNKKRRYSPSLCHWKTPAVEQFHYLVDKK